MIKQISLKYFFRNCEFGGIRAGDQRAKVLEVLGQPYFFEPQKEPWESAGIWYYSVAEFNFGSIDGAIDKNTLSFIKIKALVFSDENQTPDETGILLDPWIFGETETTIDQLRKVLKSEGFCFKDTGLETLIYTNINDYRFIPYDSDVTPEQFNVTELETFGTLVLKSGIYVRYSSDGSILGIGTGNIWHINGSEQSITFE